MKLLLLLLVVVSLLGFSTSSVIHKYAPREVLSSMDVLYTKDGCQNIIYRLVVEEPNGIKSIVSSVEHMNLTYTIGTTISPFHLVQLSVDIPYDLNGSLLKLNILNSLNQTFSHTLDNYPLVCNKFPADAFDPNKISVSGFDFTPFSSQLTFSIIIKNSEFTQFLTCTTIMGPDCAITQNMNSKEEYIVSFTPNIKIIQLETIPVEISSFLPGGLYSVSIKNPYHLDVYAAPAVEFLDFKSYDMPVDLLGLKGNIKVFNLETKKDGVLGYTLGPRGYNPNESLFKLLTPIYGNPMSKRSITHEILSNGSYTMGFTTQSTTMYVDITVPVIEIPPNWFSKSSFVKDTTIGLPLYRLEVNEANLHDPAKLSFSGAASYPMGIKKLEHSDQYYYSLHVGLFPPAKKAFVTINGNKDHSTSFLQIISPTIGTTDKIAPTMEIVSKRKVDENTVVYRLHIKDNGSGVFRILCVNPSIEFYAIDCLVQGTLNDGYFDVAFNLLALELAGPVPQFIISDLYGSNTIFDSQSLVTSNFDLDNSLFLTKNTHYSVYDISFFEFTQKDFDTSYQKRKTSLYFNLTNADVELKPALIFYDPTFKADVGTKTFVGAFDDSLKMYKIDFDLPSKPFYEKLYYYLQLSPNRMSVLSLEAIFGENAIITFDRNDCDNYPPMITNVEFLNGNQFNTSQEVQVGWTFTITDNPAGLQSGNITVVSDYDPKPRVFTLGQDTKISGTKFQSVHQIKFSVPNSFRNQRFYISKVVLTDTYGKSSFYPTQLTQLSPFLELNGQNIDIQVLSMNYTAAENILPTLTSFTTVKGAKNSITFKFSTTDLGSGISTRHNPYVFVQGFSSLFQKVDSVLVSNTSTVFNYEATVTLDYSLTYHGCLFSVYGIVDNHLNLNGYSALDLKAAGFPYYYKQLPTDPIEPSIQSWSKISQQGGALTIYGKRFTDQSKVLVDNVETPVSFLSGSIIVLNINPTTSPFTLQIQITTTVLSNQVLITPENFAIFNSIYVDPTSTCTIDCGSITNPHSSIKKALQSLNGFNGIVLKDGVYGGEENTDIVLASIGFLGISSMNGASKSIIDCENLSNAFQIYNTQFSFTDISIQNCVGNRGGAFYIENSLGSFKNINFINNKATKGAAVYSHNNDIRFMNVLFNNNQVWHDGAAIYSYLSKINILGELTRFRSNYNLDAAHPSGKDILCQNSTIIIAEQISLDYASFQCLEGCDHTYSTKSLCLNPNDFKPKQCDPNTCQNTESCLTCPDTCSCHFSGLVLETYQQGCTVGSDKQLQNCKSYSNSTLPIITLENFMGGMKNIVVRLFGYLNVDAPQDVPFIFQGGHFGLSFKVNGELQFFFNQATRFNETKVVYLTDRHSHFIEIILFSNNPDGSQRFFNLLPFTDNIRLFYSNLICGDGISNINEKNQTNQFYCPYDYQYPTFNNFITCGDGICNEEPDSCYQDCYKEMTKSCPTRQVPEGHISPGFYFSGDTLGDIISNQFIWRLPGSEHLSFGIDIVSGEEAPAPLFQFDYCSNVASNVIEDSYRGNVYHIPPEFHGKAYPQCTFATTTTSYDTASEMQSEMEQRSSNDYSASVGGSYGAFSGGGDASYSGEKSSREARKMARSNSQKIFKTDLVCKSSYIEMDEKKISLHPKLLDELDDIKGVSEMIQLVRKHGTHFYKKTFLGGKLTQLTITESSRVSEENESEWTESAAASLSASISGPSFSLGGTASSTQDKSQSTEQQQEKEASSTVTRVLVYGGTPAAFSPAEDGQSSPGFKEWAESIDVLPIPVDYQLYPIRVLFNSLWINKHGINISQVWTEAEFDYYRMQNGHVSGNHSYSLIYEFDTSSFENRVEESYYSTDIPILDITYFVQSPDNVPKEKNIFVPLYFQFTQLSGMRYNYTYQDRKPAPNQMDTLEAFYDGVNSGKKTVYQTYRTGESNGMRYPMRYDFKTEDFFSSAKTPIIKIVTHGSGPPISYRYPAKIISHETKKAILFNSGGVVEAKDRYYGTTTFQNQWAWHESYWNQFNNGIFYGSNGNMTCSRIWHPTQCVDSLEFSYRANSQPSGQNPRPVSQEFKNEDEITRFDRDFSLVTPSDYWFNFGGAVNTNVPKDLFFIENQAIIGMLTRINWMKIYYPSETQPWIFDILSYHRRNDPDIGLDQFIDVNQDFTNPSTKPYKFIKLVPFESKEAVAHQLFYYHNYNFRSEYPTITWTSTITIPVTYLFSVTGREHPGYFLDRFGDGLAYEWENTTT